MPAEHATLKCVIVRSDGRNLCDLIGQVLEARVASADICRLNEDSHLVYTHEASVHVRDWVAAELGDGESVLVVEFETWSSCGPGVDARWLARHGH